jgi:hypothetical protein
MLTLVLRHESRTTIFTLLENGEEIDSSENPKDLASQIVEEKSETAEKIYFDSINNQEESNAIAFRGLSSTQRKEFLADVAQYFMNEYGDTFQVCSQEQEEYN